jgi:hypothetical protein
LLEWFVGLIDKNEFYGDVVGEARSRKYDAELRRAFRYFYRNGSRSVCKKETVQKRLTSQELRLRKKEENIAGLQIADLLAQPALRAHKQFKVGQTISVDEDASVAVAAILENSKYDRDPQNGQVEGWGRKWFP